MLLGVLLLLNLYLEVDLDLGVAGDFSADVDHFGQVKEVVSREDIYQLHARVLRPIDKAIIDQYDFLYNTRLVWLQPIVIWVLYLYNPEAQFVANLVTTYTMTLMGAM